jgi:bifunctional DNase/RNase
MPNPMNKIQLEIKGMTVSQSQHNSYALVLGEVNGQRRLPIIIGAFEAQAIALELEKMRPSRPLTHDLFRNFADVYGINIQEVIINKFAEGIFHALLICNDGVAIKEIDSRTSDAIALALRFECPMYTYENILAQAGITFDEESSDSENEAEIESEGSVNDFNSFTTEELEMQLQKAIDDEDYEKATMIRDELRKRK